MIENVFDEKEYHLNKSKQLSCKSLYLVGIPINMSPLLPNIKLQ